MHPYLVYFLSRRSVTVPPCVASCLFHFLHIPWGLRRLRRQPVCPCAVVSCHGLMRFALHLRTVLLLPTLMTFIGRKADTDFESWPGHIFTDVSHGFLLLKICWPITGSVVNLGLNLVGRMLGKLWLTDWLNIFMRFFFLHAVFEVNACSGSRVGVPPHISSSKLVDEIWFRCDFILI
jgi:hypothetical protein